MWTRPYWMAFSLCAGLLAGCPSLTAGEPGDPSDPAGVRAAAIQQRAMAPNEPKGRTGATSSSPSGAATGGQATASHILVTYVGASRADPDVRRTREEARTRAQEVLERARAGQNSFAELAREYSDGPSGPRGGKLGTFPRGRMVSAFDDVVFALPAGSVATQVVETPFGFHVIYREK